MIMKIITIKFVIAIIFSIIHLFIYLFSLCIYIIYIYICICIYIYIYIYNIYVYTYVYILKDRFLALIIGNRKVKHSLTKSNHNFSL